MLTPRQQQRREELFELTRGVAHECESDFYDIFLALCEEDFDEAHRLLHLTTHGIGLLHKLICDIRAAERDMNNSTN